MQDSITEMLASLEWPPLQLRRKCAILTLLYKIIHNLIEIPNSYCTCTYQHYHLSPLLDLIMNKNSYTIIHQ